MRIPPRPGLALCLLLAGACAAQAQGPANGTPRPSVPAPLASAPGDGKPARHLMSPEALRDSATAPGELRPVRPALPLVTLPLGQPQADATPPEPRPAPAPAGPAGPAASVPGVSDAVARCEARPSLAERRRCRRELAQQAPVALPSR